MTRRHPALLFSLFLALALLAIFLSRRPGSIATVWFANALAVGWLAGVSPRRWPAQLGAVALANLLANVTFDPRPAQALAFVPGNLIEITLGATMLRATLRREPRWLNALGLVRVLVAGAVLPAAVGAVIGSAVLAALGVAPFGAALPNWFIGTLTGAVAVLPLVLLLMDIGLDDFRRRVLTPRSIGALALIAAVVVIAPRLSTEAGVVVAAVLMIGAAAGGVVTAGVAMLLATVLFNAGIALQWFAAPSALDPVVVFASWLVGLLPAALFAATLENLRAAVDARAAQAASVRRLYDLTPALALAVDPDGRIVQTTRLWREHFARTADTIEGTPLAPHVDPGSGPAFKALWAASLSDAGRAAVAELDWRHGLGHAVPVRVSIDWERDADGRGRRALLVLEDLTALRASVQHLRTEHERHRSLLMASNDGVVTTDGQGHILEMNPAASQMLGQRDGQGVGRFFDEVVRLGAAEGKPAPPSIAQACAQPGVPVHFEARLPAPAMGGTSIDVRGESVAIASPDGTAVATVTTLADLTKARAVEQALREAEAGAQAASAAKTRFLSNMSHEIRTPLNAVIGLVMTMDDATMPPVHLETLTRVRVAARNLLALVNDILDVTRIEAGELLLDQRPFNLFDLLAEVESVYAPQALTKGLTFSVDVAPDVPLELTGDAQRLTQILSNLIGNALKFTETGSIEVDVRCVETDVGEGASPDDVVLRLAVRDTGIGVPPALQSRLFQPFWQADSGNTRRFDGSGLGLSIVRQLALLMGGEAGCESQGEGGSAFWVTVALKPLGAGESLDGRGGSLELWVVDDGDADRLSAIHQARSLGWYVTGLADGASVLERLRERQAKGARPPDALVVDWWMPGMEGLTLLREVATLMPGAQRPVSLLMSSHGRQLLQEMGGDELADGLLDKPVQADRLFNALDGAVVRRGGGLRVLELTRLDNELAWLSGLDILVVDDVPDNLEVASRLLLRAGARVQTAGSGPRALQMLAESTFDVVLMDVQMPVMDGREATRRLREDPRHDLTAIVALTAGAFVDERRQALEVGMDEFVTKPFAPADLVRAVRRAMQARRGQASPVAALSSATVTASPVPTTAPFPDIELLDTAAARERLGNDAALMWRLLRSMLGEFASYCHDLPEHMPDSSERARWARTVHKLRGAAGTVGAVALSQAAARLERLLRQAEAFDLAELRHLHQAVGDAFAEVRDAAQRASLTYDAATAPTADAPAPPAGDADVAHLLALLQAFDLSALAVFNDLRPALGARMGVERTQQIRQALEVLDFPTAAVLMVDETT